MFSNYLPMSVTYTARLIDQSDGITNHSSEYNVVEAQNHMSRFNMKMQRS